MFRGVEHPAAIVAQPKKQVGALPIPCTFDFKDRSAIAKFLSINKLVEPIMETRGVDSAAIIRQKMDFIVISVAAEMKEVFTGTTRRDLPRMSRQ
ncbi:MAG: hypothetical protein ACJAVT_000610 [Yoonia sp.]|jgi:hypothetical protein